MLPAIGAFLLLAAPGLYFAAKLNAEADASIVSAANKLQVFERLPHHLLATAFAPGYVTRQILLWVVFFLLCAQVPAKDGNRRFRWFIGAAISISTLGFILALLAAVAPDCAAYALRLYWYRLTDVLVPCGVAIVGMQFVLNLFINRRILARWLLAGLLFVAAYDLSNQARHFPWLPEAWGRVTSRSDKFVNYDDWRDVCRWAAENTPSGTVFITPRNSGTFKWYSGRDEVATWKDMPQDAVSVVQWRERMRDLFAADGTDPMRPWRASQAEAGDERLRALAQKYQAQYVIVEIVPGTPPLSMMPVHKNKSYAVYRFE
jgi:hypothetical protein